MVPKISFPALLLIAAFAVATIALTEPLWAQVAERKWDSGNATQVLAGGATITAGQVTLSTTAAQVLAASSTRRRMILRNNDAAINIFLGPAGVTAANGILVKPGDPPLPISSTAAVFAVAASGTPVVSWLNEGQ